MNLAPVVEFLGVDQIHLVEDEKPWNLVELELCEDPLDGRDLVLDLRTGGIDQVEEEVGLFHLFEGRLEGGEQIPRQIADEADGVVDDDLLFVREPEPAAGRVERREHPLFGDHLAVGQGVEKGALSRIGVADDRDDGKVSSRPLGTTLLTTFTDVGQLLLKEGNPVADPASVDFQLGLSGATASDSTHQTGHLAPAASQSRQQVFQLGQFDLDAPLAGLRPLGEEVEDQLGAVDDLEIGRRIDRPDLRRGQLPIEDDHIGSQLERADDDLLELALADECSGVECGTSLEDLVEDDQSTGVGQLDQLVEGVPGIAGCTLLAGGDTDEQGAIPRVGGFARTTIAGHLRFEGVDQVEKIDLQLARQAGFEELEHPTLLTQPVCLLLRALGLCRQEVGREDLSGETGLRVDFNRGHQIEPQECQIGEVVVGQLPLPAQMRVHTAQPVEPRLPETRPILCGKDNLRGIPDDDVLNVPFAIDEDADLAPNLVRKLRQLPCKLGRDDLVCRNTPLVDLLQSTNLVGFEPQRFSLNLRDEMAPFDGSVDHD